MRTGLKIPYSSSCSSGWHASFPGLSPDSASPTLGPLPPFSRLQEPVLFRLLLVDPGPASPSNWFLELWISLCLWKRPGKNLLLPSSERMCCDKVPPVSTQYLTDEHASCHGEPGAGGEVWSDHDAQAGLREGQLVGVEDEELVHHDDRRGVLTMGLACENGPFNTCSLPAA